jgi:mannose/fructose/N-acetylgalactosamine-specific phosphotransferase system component IIB
MIFNDYGIKYSAFNSFRKARLDDKTLKHVTPNKYKINAISFDEYVYKKKIKPDFIKIDAESVEYEILKGMNKTIEEFHPIISLEVGDMAIPGAKTSRETILYLIRQGYEAFEYRDNKVVKHNLKDQYGYDNILFLYK